MLKQKGNASEKECSDCIEYVHIIKSSANILHFLVKDMIDLMQIRQNKFNQNINTNSFSALQDACQEVVNCYKLQARDKKIGLKVTISDERSTTFRTGLCFDS
jgi:signal transduction histidine kinase